MKCFHLHFGNVCLKFGQFFGYKGLGNHFLFALFECFQFLLLYIEHEPSALTFCVIKPFTIFALFFVFEPAIFCLVAMPFAYGTDKICITFISVPAISGLVAVASAYVTCDIHITTEFFATSMVCCPRAEA